MRMRQLVLGIAVICLASSAQPVFAQDNTGAHVVTKLFRGLTNAVTGWLEIPKQISQTYQESGPGPAFTWGFVKGIGCAVARSVVGGYEIVTFPFPIPEGYRPIMQPEYVLSDLPQAPNPK